MMKLKFKLDKAWYKVHKELTIEEQNKFLKDSFFLYRKQPSKYLLLYAAALFLSQMVVNIPLLSFTIIFIVFAHFSYTVLNFSFLIYEYNNKWRSKWKKNKA